MAKTYDTYKDSGIAWIGEIPGEWRVGLVGKYFKEINNPNINQKETNTLQFKMGEIISKSKGDSKYSPETIEAYNVVEPDTIMINGLNLSFDLISQRVAQVRERGAITSTYLAIWPINGMKSDYAKYLLKAYDNNKALHAMGRGLRATLSYRTFRSEPILIPTIEEQQSISSFLDEKCGEINSLISIQEEMISELLAYKQSVITEAVTKGLDKKAKMKNSGVEWIGDIPEEWEVCKVKNIFYLSTGTTPKSFDSINDGEETVNWFTPTDIIDGGNELWCSKRKLSINTIENEGICLFPPKTLMYVGIGATAGKVGFACVKGYSNQQITALISKGYGDKYFYYLLNSIRVMIRENAFFTTLPIINNSYLGQKSIPVPPLPVQQAIATYLDEKTSQIDSLIALKQSKIESLKEYKKSIIYEYVTGKKRV